MGYRRIPVSTVEWRIKRNCLLNYLPSKTVHDRNRTSLHCPRFRFIVSIIIESFFALKFSFLNFTSIKSRNNRQSLILLTSPFHPFNLEADYA